MFVTTKLRLRQSVGIVTSQNLVEFFKANIRSNLSLKMRSEGIVDFLKNFNGQSSIQDIVDKNHELDINQVQNLAGMLLENYVLIEQNCEYSDEIKSVNYRLINLLEDYFHSTNEVLNSIKRIKESTVVIFGLGAVGSYVALYLAKIGVGSFVFVDPDVVEISNLHRQSFVEADLGHYKATQLAKRVRDINSTASVKSIIKPLGENFFDEEEIGDEINLIINCADEPSVDFTSRIVSKYAMKRNIPHIVGGGYNLHLTLTGQTIIPYKTACFKCFEMTLEAINGVEFNNVKRLHRENRKLGSFSPLSGISASLAALDSFKLLAGADKFLQQINRRVEFSAKHRKFNILDIPRRLDCPWCGSI